MLTPLQQQQFNQLRATAAAHQAALDQLAAELRPHREALLLMALVGRDHAAQLIGADAALLIERSGLLYVAGALNSGEAQRLVEAIEAEAPPT